MNWLTRFVKVGELERPALEGKLAPEDAKYILDWIEADIRGETRVLDQTDAERVDRIHAEHFK